MKPFSFTPLLITGALVASIAGCASTASHQTHTTKPAMAMGANDKDKMAKGGCACCGMHKDNASNDTKQGPMAMMQGKSQSDQAGMCMSGMDGKSEGGCGCCGMQDMAEGGGCGMSKSEMTSDMHKKMMESKQQKVPAQPPAK